MTRAARDVRFRAFTAWGPQPKRHRTLESALREAERIPEGLGAAAEDDPVFEQYFGSGDDERAG